MAIHHQGRLLPVEEAAECAPRRAPVQASGEETAKSAQGSSAVRSEQTLQCWVVCLEDVDL